MHALRLVRPGLIFAVFTLRAFTAAITVAPVSAPRFTHPGAGQIYYFVLTDRFANGSAANDTGGIAGGPDVSGFDPTRIGYFHGGDFAGLTARLDYIKNLGVTEVWVTPPMHNKAMQRGSAGYHGYWILDFLHVDPHLGTDDEFREFVKQAHARGLKVCLDIVINHTADVIQYRGGKTDYIPKSVAPYRDASGQPFEPDDVAFNGLNDPAAFPALSAERSFAYVPFVPPEEANAKNPAWLNDVTIYHNRGNSLFEGESARNGDFGGLDDVFTENPAVVRGFIDIYRHWIDDFGVDSFRIDTAKHVNLEFWQAFAPAIRAHAPREFVQFGEVWNHQGDVGLISAFNVATPLDASLDFAFRDAMRAYVSQGHDAADLAALIANDDYYTDHDSNAQTLPTFLDNHDQGRFAYFLLKDNPGATRGQLEQLVRLGHALLFLSRGQPVVYYGDEQGMMGRAGDDQHAREDMFASKAPEFRDAPLLGTTRSGADDKFDEQHPLYRFIQALAGLRRSSAALSRGAMIVHPTGDPHVFAFSRIERNERIEYLAVFNNSRDAAITATLPTNQPAGAKLQRVVVTGDDTDYPDATLITDTTGGVTVTLPPLHFALWRASTQLPLTVATPAIAFTSPAPGATLTIPTREIDGHTLAIRPEIRAEVSGGDGFAEVTFTLVRASRPGQYELLGTDDAAPYRVFWQPPSDLAPGEEFSLIATVDDLRGHRSATCIDGLKTAAGTPVFGIKGATVPKIDGQPAADLAVDFGAPLALTVHATGTGPLSYQWLRDGVEVPGGNSATLSFEHAIAALSGNYRVLVRGLAGSVLSEERVVTVSPATAGRIEHLPPIESKFIAQRRVDVWLPPGYDTNTGERYPVLYIHDGQNIFDPVTSYSGSSWEVDQAMCRLMRAGKLRGAIIVGVWNTPARFDEYMPQKAVTTPTFQVAPGWPVHSAAAIQSDAYLQYLVGELKPVIDRTYRTLPDAAHTAIMGSSMGGLISAYAINEYPNVFGRAGCVSTHWPLGDGMLIGYFGRHLPKPGLHRIYFDFGTATLDSNYEPYQQRVDAALRAAGYTEGKDWLTRKFPGHEHSERFWRQRVEIPLEFLLSER